MTTIDPRTTGIALISEILIAQGVQRYLTDWDGEITASIVDLSSRAETLPTIARPGSADRYQLRVSRRGGKPSRRFDYDRLASDDPVLFHRAVTITPPEVPYTLSFRAKGKRRSDAWDELRSVGWQGQAYKYDDQRAAGLIGLRAKAEKLAEIRDRNKVAAKRESDHRAELANWLAAERTGRGRLPDLSHGDGVVTVTPKKPSRSIDLDVALSDPHLRRYVKLGAPTAEYTTVWFSRVTDEFDPEGDQEPFEGY